MRHCLLMPRLQDIFRTRLTVSYEQSSASSSSTRDRPAGGASSERRSGGLLQATATRWAWAAPERNGVAPRALASGGVQPVLHASLANSMHRRNADIDGRGDGSVIQPLVGFEQNARTRHPPRGRAPRAQQVLRRLAFHAREIDHAQCPVGRRAASAVA